MKKIYVNPEMNLVSMDSFNLLLPISGGTVPGGYAPSHEPGKNKGKNGYEEDEEEEEEW